MTRWALLLLITVLGCTCSAAHAQDDSTFCVDLLSAHDCDALKLNGMCDDPESKVPWHGANVSVHGVLCWETCGACESTGSCTVPSGFTLFPHRFSADMEVTYDPSFDSPTLMGCVSDTLATDSRYEGDIFAGRPRTLPSMAQLCSETQACAGVQAYTDDYGNATYCLYSGDLAKSLTWGRTYTGGFDLSGPCHGIFLKDDLVSVWENHCTDLDFGQCKDNCMVAPQSSDVLYQYMEVYDYNYVMCRKSCSGCATQGMPTRLRKYSAPDEMQDRASTYEGRVEVLYEGAWGAVCDQGWNDAAATVACRAFMGQVQVVGRALLGPAVVKGYGRSTLPVLLGSVECTGAEADLSQCKLKAPWGSPGLGLPAGACSPDKVAGALCSCPTLPGFTFIPEKGPSNQNPDLDPFVDSPDTPTCGDFNASVTLTTVAAACKADPACTGVFRGGWENAGKYCLIRGSTAINSLVKDVGGSPFSLWSHCIGTYKRNPSTATKKPPPGRKLAKKPPPPPGKRLAKKPSPPASAAK